MTSRALARCVGDADAFLERGLGAAPHRWHAEGGFEDLLSLAAVDDALTGTGLRFPAVRLVRDGEVLDRAEFTRSARTGRTTIDDLVDPGRALALFADGATIVLQSLQRWWPPLAAFCRDLELALGHQVQANAYLTPAGAAGLAPHHDTHDVFVLQVHGTKSWTVRSPVVEAPLASQRSDHDAAARQPVLFDAELRPGDSLYLPRGFVHSATAQAATSLHVTIGILATTVHGVLRRLVDEAARDDARFRRSLPPGTATDPAAAAALVREVAGDLAAWLATSDVAPIAEGMVERFWSNRRPLLDGQLLAIDRLDELDDDTPVEPRPLLAARTSVVGDRLVVSLGDRELDLPAAVEPDVRRLLDGTARCAADLADRLDAAGRLVLVRRLVREGLLCPSG